MKQPVLTIVVPCYNEEEVLPTTIECLHKLLITMIDEEQISSESNLLFVDDGSKDLTWSIIHKGSLTDNHIRGLKLSRNVGHQNALLAGLFTAKDTSDCVLSIDADLQDDIHVIPTFVDMYKKGHDIVYGVRKKRDCDTFFKRSSAEFFYRLMDKMGVNLVYNHADFRLMSKRALQELEKYEEVNMFLRGIVPLIGYRSTSVYYDRKERLAGETKYPLKKMLYFAFDGITSFSVTPIRFVLITGLVSFLVSLLFGIYFLTLKWIGDTETGWTSLITSIWLIGGLQLIGIGLIGEYIGKIYKESKRRPKYTVEIDSRTFTQPLPLTNTQRVKDESYNLNLRKLPETN